MIAPSILADLAAGARLAPDQAFALVGLSDLSPLLEAAARRRDTAHGHYVSYSRKVFIPLTQLCRDVCHYCTFAHAPRKGERAFLSRDEVLAIARAERRQAARRRCSRSATSRSCAISSPATRWPNSATRPPSPISPRWRTWCSAKPAFCPM